MKITIDLPDWCDERNIRIMAGVEMVAYKLACEDVIHVKKVRCSYCGDCCRDLSEKWHLGLNYDNCKYLKDNKCSLVEVPFSCIGGSQEKGKFNNKNCTVEYDVRKI